MRYTVLNPQAAPTHEYGPYLRIAEESGVNIADTERVLEPAPSKRWLPVWNDEAAAQQVARQLRELTEVPSWSVHTLNGEVISRGPLGPVWIHVGIDGDGFIYKLSHYSRKLIGKRFPEAKSLDRVTVDTRDPALIESKQSVFWQRIVEMLTGLDAEQLNALGGYRFYHPKTKSEWGPVPQPA